MPIPAHLLHPLLQSADRLAPELPGYRRSPDNNAALISICLYREGAAGEPVLRNQRALTSAPERVS
jgi:hypothetical protein